MKIVERNSKKEKMWLSENEVKLFKKHFSGLGADKYTENRVVQIAEKIRDYKYWVICDCRKESIDSEQTIFTLRLSGQTQKLHAAKLPNSIEHDANCPLYRKPSNATGHSVKPSCLSDVMYFGRNVTSKGIAAVGNKPTNSASVSTQSKEYKISRLLYYLLEKSGINSFTKKMHSLSEVYGALKKQTEEEILFPKYNYTLSSVFWTLPYQVIYAYQKLQELSKQWPVNLMPQGYGLVTAKEIDLNTNTIVCMHKEKLIEIKVHGAIRTLSGFMSNINSGPYLAFLFIKRKSSKSEYYCPTEAFITPIYNRASLLPVDSNFEREILKEMLPLIEQLDLSLEKPLFDIEVSYEVDGESILAFCRPDFILS